ncbi:MAG: MutS-related protein [Rhodanobacteraceae bacterium]
MSPKRRALAELRGRWGRPGSTEHGPANGYFNLVRDRLSQACVDDKTWADLEFPKIFANLDSTVTPVGSQVLFRQMHEYIDDADALANRYATYARLRSEAGPREALQRELLPLQHEASARICDFIFGALPAPPRHQGLLRAWALASLGVLVAVFAWPWLIWVWLAMVFVNVALRVRAGISGRTLRDIQILQACLQLVKVANDLAAMHARNPWVPQLAKLGDEGPNRADLSKALGWLLMWTFWSRVFPIMVVVGLLNIAFLVDLVLYARAMQRFSGLRHKLAASFELVGEIDAAIAVASWLAYCPDHCRPTLTGRAVLDIEAGRHPLLTDGVANSVRVVDRSALVTGSNMAGKTTFIKMLATNALLGQTLGFCVASRAAIPRSRVMASIQAGHSVASGKSHYFSEVETIHSFLDRQARGGCTIFAIDELFSGTNTVERVAIARAVLESLGRRSLVLATTHDVELQAFLGDHYDLFHFQEDPKVDGFFDYRLRPGPTTERNAIRLLGEIGFPDGIIANAMKYAEQES